MMMNEKKMFLKRDNPLILKQLILNPDQFNALNQFQANYIKKVLINYIKKNIQI